MLNTKSNKAILGCQPYQHLYKTELTLKKTFEERGEFAVNLEKEANWLSIQRKKQHFWQFKERVNQPPAIIHYASVSQKKIRNEEVAGR